MEDKIAIILPVRSAGTTRYERLSRCLDSYLQVTEKMSDVYVLHDDDECHLYDPILAKYPTINNLCVKSGISLMEKINIPALDIANKYKYVGFIGDDIIFRTRWEYEFIQWLSKQEYGLAFANDLIHITGALATHPFITSNLIKAVGFFGCPALTHQYFDNYWMRIVEKVGKIKFFDKIIMEHMHPLVNKALKDKMFFQIESMHDMNTKNYLTYLSLNFDNDIRKIKEYKL